MPSGIDPNLFISLAESFVGGVNMPAAADAGNWVRVNAAGDNLSYSPGSPMGTGGNVQQGTVDLDDLGNPVAVSCPTINSTNFVLLTCHSDSGAPGSAPRVAITPGVGFSLTGDVNDGSTYFYRVIL
jgi:hypothetical protein